MKNKFKFLPFILLFAAGCASSPVGPGSGVVQSVVKGSVNEVNQRAQSVLAEMKIQVTGTATKNSGNELQLTGRSGDTNVVVTIDNANNETSNVEVEASKNMVNGDKDLAQDILNRIVRRG